MSVPIHQDTTSVKNAMKPKRNGKRHAEAPFTSFLYGTLTMTPPSAPANDEVTSMTVASWIASVRPTSSSPLPFATGTDVASVALRVTMCGACLYAGAGDYPHASPLYVRRRPHGHWTFDAMISGLAAARPAIDAKDNCVSKVSAVAMPLLRFALGANTHLEFGCGLSRK
ncbi:hypothetical protein C8Q79DRAFT_926321 [Trametes meyenii]|nr:hypothetical protein C8Q79DRAFT_926321 [Trametes meyenii]